MSSIVLRQETPSTISLTKRSFIGIILKRMIKTSKQIDQDSSGNQKNVIQGQKQNMENSHTQQRT